MKRVVLITGAAGGIGMATAAVFAGEGWHVIGVDTNPIDNSIGATDTILADVSDLKAMEQVFNEVASKEGQLDALVNNAAIQICKPLLETTVEEWDITMKTNLRSVFLTVRYAHPLLKINGGAIINVSSVHAIATSRGISAYAASKGALVALTRALALELAEDNIRVNAVLPGAVDTPMLHAGLHRGHIQGKNPQELFQHLGKRHPIDRVGRPEEISQAILFLADEHRSSFITGQAMVVDGGATAKLSTE